MKTGYTLKTAQLVVDFQRDCFPAGRLKLALSVSLC